MFIAYVEQDKGCGCDYTIACGKVIIGLKSENKEDALKELKEKIVGKYNKKENYFIDGMNYCEGGLDRVTLYEVSSSERMPLDKWIQEAKDILESFEEKETEEAERKEFERLNKKFGNK